MTHDVEWLLELIMNLEKRILELERESGYVHPEAAPDSWYWDH